MTFNLHHGIDGTKRYNLQRAVDAIARIGPDLVGLQEITRNHPRYGCDDQPARLAAGLQRATGRPWYQAYAKEWTVHTDRACMAQGQGDGPNTEGLAFLAPEPLDAVKHRELPDSRLALSVRLRSVPAISFIVTHLTHGSKGAPDRVRQIDELLPWARRRGRERILLGDLNTRPGAPELAPLAAEYRDAWREGVSAGVHGGVRGGATHVNRGSRIDYVLFTAGLQLERVETVDTSALLGVHASDHHAVVASFRVP
jgi:endonuclease/exonuclease/phosphatase family metal-dependent hydrolase